MNSRYLLLLSLFLGLLISCSKEIKSQKVTATIHLTEEMVRQYNQKVLSSNENRKTVTEPTTIGGTGYNCMGVFVTNLDETSKGSCTNQSTGVVATSPTAFFGLFSLDTTGGSFSIEVSEGANISFEIFALRSEIPGVVCPQEGGNFEAVKEFLSAPTILGESGTVNISGPSTINITLSTTNKIVLGDCTDILFDSEQASGLCEESGISSTETNHLAAQTGTFNIICNPEQLFSLENTGDASDFTKNYLLGQDIDMQPFYDDGGSEFILSAEDFEGIFSGDGFTISNFTFDGSNDQTGFIRHLTANGTLRDISFNNITMSSNIPGTGEPSIGSVVGFLEGIIESVIVDVNSSVSATSTSNSMNTGGLVGLVKEPGSIRTAITGASVSNLSTVADVPVGGLAGLVFQTSGAASPILIKESAAKGSITVSPTSSALVGGFIGQMQNDASSIALNVQTSYSTGTITMQGSGTMSVGGFIGSIENGGGGITNVLKNYTSSEININDVSLGSKNVGGFVAEVNSSSVSISDNFSVSEINTLSLRPLAELVGRFFAVWGSPDSSNYFSTSSTCPNCGVSQSPLAGLSTATEFENFSNPPMSVWSTDLAGFTCDRPWGPAVAGSLPLLAFENTACN
jgi:hypothetical protein